jgi:hypothetical protein
MPAVARRRSQPIDASPFGDARGGVRAFEKLEPHVVRL